MPAASWIRVIFGTITVAIATVPLLALFHVIPSRAPAPGDAPSWLGVAILLAFLLGGIMMIVNGVFGTGDASGDLSGSASRSLRAVYRLAGFAIVVLLAVIFTWVAFGPGEGHFSVSGGSAGAALATHTSGSGDILGRIAFGAAAVVAWLVIGFGIVSWMRVRLVERR